MKVTALLGAGAFIEIGGSTTNDITESIINHRLKFQDRFKKDIDEPFLLNIANELNKFWKPEKCNFEDILDTLEKLFSYRLFGSDPKYFKPSLGAFIAPAKDKQYFFKREYLKRSIMDLVTIIGDSVNQYDSAFQCNKENKWFCSFWQKIVKNCDLNIATLNYDTCIEQSLISYEDGFEEMGENYLRFNPKKLRSTSMPRVLHLHGCINYGYPKKNSRSTCFFDNDNQELFKYKDYSKARQSWETRPISTNQSHEATMIGPLISGLGKTDKLIVYPYLDYNHVFYESLLHSDRLLIAGYSFGDFHLNKMLERIAYLPKKKKLAIVTYCDKNNFSWNKESCIRRISPMEEFIIKNTKSDSPFYNPFESPAESKDGSFRLYFNGMKCAIENKERSLLDFLTT